jgi:DNA-binding Lrp family transcriptional regulator
MPLGDTLDELDLALVNALQIAPRASWTQVAAALEVDAATVARRWERLRESGNAWVTVHPYTGTGAGAVVEISCVPGRKAAVADTLSADARAVSIEHTAGGRDLLVTVVAADFASLSHYVVDRIGGVAGITASRTHLTTRIYTDGSHWRLRSLTRTQQEALTASRNAAKGAVAPVGGQRELVIAMGEDARAPVSELATRLGVSVNTASRRLARLLDSGRLRLRCDLARSLSGSPISVTYFGTVPPEHLETAARELAKLSEVRACAGTAGPQNLVAMVWVASLLDAQNLEVSLAARLPHLRITDRAVALRTVKLAGRLLDNNGRARGHVPIDLWG